ncbi:hypothetical protein Hypma_006810 [Hypsizygus marmoreus]|uniref:DUF6593 domain-containing protein n=1 Tax=Hypsizygus marmoreus TaxID=39966 RepID=A0A369JU63_HYPMA|nr:hypothetical protein Hypma_006810 [Hypsizygus marmoreus]
MANPDNSEPPHPLSGLASASTPALTFTPTLTFAPLPLPTAGSSRGTQPLTLAFHPDHPCSTQISDAATNRLLYIVETDVIKEPLRKKRVVTKVRNAGGQSIAEFEWRDLFKSDTVALTRAIAGGVADKGESKAESSSGSGGDLITMPASTWLKKSSVPFRDTVTYKDPGKNDFKWKGFAPGLSLELFSSQQPSYPLARFYKSGHSDTSSTSGSSESQVIVSDGTSRVETKVHSRTRAPARLTLDASIVAAGQVDEVVVAFLYLEKIRRERDDDEFRPVPKTKPELARKSSSATRPGTAD